MGKVIYSMELTNDSLAHMKEIEGQLAETGKLKKPVDWTTMFITEPLKSVDPKAVTLDTPK